MKKEIFMSAAAFVCLGLYCVGDALGSDVKLVYPTDAAAAELDNTRPENRIEPPIRELSEQDVVTPLGQVQNVLNQLNGIEATVTQLSRDVSALKGLDLSGVLPVVEKTAQEQQQTLSKLVELREMVADLRATVDSAEKATANVKAIQENKLTIFLLVAILTLLICQVIWKFGAGIWATLKERRRAYIVAEAEKLRQQYAQQTQTAAQPVAAATTTQQ